MNAILLSLIINYCSITKIKNETVVWNNEDVSNLTRAKVRCFQLFKKSPCLNQFVKRSERNYWAICGKPLEK